MSRALLGKSEEAEEQTQTSQSARHYRNELEKMIVIVSYLHLSWPLSRDKGCSSKD